MFGPGRTPDVWVLDRVEEPTGRQSGGGVGWGPGKVEVLYF